MEVAVAAIIAATGAAVGIAVLLCVYRLITLLGDPVNAKMEAEIDEPEQRSISAARALGGVILRDNWSGLAKPASRLATKA